MKKHQCLRCGNKQIDPHECEVVCSICRGDRKMADWKLVTDELPVSTGRYLVQLDIDRMGCNPNIDPVLVASFDRGKGWYYFEYDWNSQHRLLVGFDLLVLAWQKLPSIG